MVKIFWTKQAKKDLKEIFVYIAKNSPKYAHLQIKRIREKVQLTKTQNHLGKINPDFNNPKVREFVIGNYRVVYHIVNSKRIDILLVHHGNRDLTKRITKS